MRPKRWPMMGGFGLMAGGSRGSRLVRVTLKRRRDRVMRVRVRMVVGEAQLRVWLQTAVMPFTVVFVESFIFAELAGY